MKTLLAGILIIMSFYATAQKIDLKLNAGNISSLSIGLSTWKWLYIGASYKTNDPFYIPNADNRTGKYIFYTYTLFIQPTITINKNCTIYGIISCGSYFPTPIQLQKTYDYVISSGINYRIYKRLWGNAECGYLQVNSSAPNYNNSVYSEFHGYESSRLYGAVGVRLLLNTGEHKKKPNQ